MNPPSYSIGKSKRRLSRKERSPGPNAYNIPRNLDSRGSTFGKSRRPKTESVNPGPGAYNQTINFISSPKAILIPKSKPDHLENTPGPGTYSTFSPSSTVSYSMRSRHDRLIINTVPGPGAYSISAVLKTSPRVLFERSPKSRKASVAVPGPG